MTAALKYKGFEDFSVPESFDTKMSIGTWGRNGMTLVAALGSAFAVNAGHAQKWVQEQIINNDRIHSGLYVSSDWSSVVDDAKDIKSISAGVPKSLDVKWLLMSLNEHNGGLLSETQFAGFREAMVGFSGLRFLDCYVAYRKNNDIIRTTIILENEFALVVTYFVDDEDPEVAFSLEYDEQTMLTGHGLASDIAKATVEIVNTVMAKHG